MRMKIIFAARGGHFGLTVWNFLKGKNPHKLRRKPGSMIKIPDTPGTIKIQHNKNIKQNRCKNNGIYLKMNV